MTVLLIRSRALVLAVVILCLGLVAGCGSEPSVSPPPPTTWAPPPTQPFAKGARAKGGPVSDPAYDSARGAQAKSK